MAVIGARPATWLDGLSGRLVPRSRIRRPASSPGTRRRTSHGARARREAISLPIVVLAIALAAVLGLFQISLSSNVAAAGYSIDTLNGRLAQLESDHQDLLYQIGQAQSPDRIAARAAALGLSTLSPDHIGFARPSADLHP
jgi:cell division protein FtsL